MTAPVFNPDRAAAAAAWTVGDAIAPVVVPYPNMGMRTGNEQTFQVPYQNRVASVHVWSFPANSRPALNAGFGASRYMVGVGVRADGRFNLNVTDNPAGDTNADLSAQFEAQGTVEISVAGHTITVALDNIDMNEAYLWPPSNSAEVTALYNALAGNTASATVTLRDFTPGPIEPTRPIAYAAQGALPAGIMLEGYQETVGSGNSQTFSVPYSGRTNVQHVWAYPNNGRPMIDSSLGTNRELNQVGVTHVGGIAIAIGSGVTGEDLSDQFEMQGSVVLSAAGHTVIASIAGADMSDPYVWTPDNASEVVAFYNALAGNTGALSFTLRDFTPFQRNRARLVPDGPLTRGGSGNIVVRATNSAGSDDWTLPYAISGFFGALGNQKIQAGAWGRSKFSGGIGAIGGTKLR